MSLSSSGKLNVWGEIEARQLKLNGSYTFFEVNVPTGSYNAIRGYDNGQNRQIVSRLHFFDDTWNTGNLLKSSGCINIDGIDGVTLGEWHDPVLIMDKDNRRVSIGGTTTDNTFRLSVNGTIGAKTGIKVMPANQAFPTAWPDYVFEENYELKNLKQVEAFIQTNGHLPDVPSAKEVNSEGVELVTMDATLLKKIEELTLYMIEQNKRLKAQEEKIEALTKLIQTSKKE
jgi:hypothetical protein